MKKKVIIEARDKVVRAECLKDSDFIGIKFNVAGEKGFIQKISTGNYIVGGFSARANTYFDLNTMNSIAEVVDQSIRILGLEVFVFDTWQELYKWLAEDL